MIDVTFEFAVEVEVLRYRQRVEEDVFLETQTQIGSDLFKNKQQLLNDAVKFPNWTANFAIQSQVNQAVDSEWIWKGTVDAGADVVSVDDGRSLAGCLDSGEESQGCRFAASAVPAERRDVALVRLQVDVADLPSVGEHRTADGVVVVDARLYQSTLEGKHDQLLWIRFLRGLVLGLTDRWRAVLPGGGGNLHAIYWTDCELWLWILSYGDCRCRSRTWGWSRGFRSRSWAPWVPSRWIQDPCPCGASWRSRTSPVFQSSTKSDDLIPINQLFNQLASHLGTWILSPGTGSTRVEPHGTCRIGRCWHRRQSASRWRHQPPAWSINAPQTHLGALAASALAESL